MPIAAVERICARRSSSGAAGGPPRQSCYAIFAARRVGDPRNMGVIFIAILHCQFAAMEAYILL